MLVASKQGPRIINAFARALQNDAKTPIEEGIREFTKLVKDTGIHFREGGNIHSEIILPDDSESKANALLDEEMRIRRKVGQAIDKVDGYKKRFHLGNLFTDKTTHTAMQRFPTLEHKDQGDYNHIDLNNDAGCNLAILKTTPNWFVKDKNAQSSSSDHDDFPSDLQERIHVADQSIVTLDNPQSNPEAPSVLEQRKAFADAVRSSVENTEVLVALHQIIGYCNSLLRGKKHTVLICSVQVYEETFDCAPPEDNSFINFLGNTCHMQCLCQAGKYLSRRAHGELDLLTNRLIEFFRYLLGLPSDFHSKYLMKRSGCDKMSKEEKRLIAEEAFQARSKGGTTSGTNHYLNKTGVFNPDLIPDGYDNWGAWARDNELGIFDSTKLPDGFNSWGEWARDNEEGIFDSTKLPDGFNSWGEWARDNELGIFDSTKLPDGYDNWGAWVHDNELGIFDSKNVKKVADGNSKGGTNTYLNKIGLFDPKNAEKKTEGRKKGKLNQERAYWKKKLAEGEEIHLYQCKFQPKKTKREEWNGGCGGETWSLSSRAVNANGKNVQMVCKRCTHLNISNHHRQFNARVGPLNEKQIDIAYDEMLERLTHGNREPLTLDQVIERLQK